MMPMNSHPPGSHFSGKASPFDGAMSGPPEGGEAGAPPVDDEGKLMSDAAKMLEKLGAGDPAVTELVAKLRASPMCQESEDAGETAAEGGVEEPSGVASGY